MARRSMVIAAVVLVLGLISVGSGFAAELTRVKSSQIEIVDGKCVHPSNPVVGLAITGAVAMFLLRVVVRVATGSGYACCRTRPNVPKLIRYCIILAWLMSFVAVGQFIAGAKLSNQKDPKVTYMSDYECDVVKPGFFSGCALEALVSLCLTLFYYLVIASAQNPPTTRPPAALDVEAPPARPKVEVPPAGPEVEQESQVSNAELIANIAIASSPDETNKQHDEGLKQQ